jgi:hypothetical protein
MWKFKGKLVGVKMAEFRQQTDESRGYVFEKSSYRLGIFSPA